MSVRLIRQLLDSGTDLVARREAREGLRRELELDEQRAREEAGLLRFVRCLDNGRERDLARELVGEGISFCRRRSVDDLAAKFHRSPEFVRAFRARLLRALEGRAMPPVRARGAA